MKLKDMSKKQLRKEVKNLQEITAGALILFAQLKEGQLDRRDIEYLLTSTWDSMSGNSVYDIDEHEFRLVSKLLKLLENA